MNRALSDLHAELGKFAGEMVDNQAAAPISAISTLLLDASTTSEAQDLAVKWYGSEPGSHSCCIDSTECASLAGV